MYWWGYNSISVSHFRLIASRHVFISNNDRFQLVINTASKSARRRGKHALRARAPIIIIIINSQQSTVHSIFTTNRFLAFNYLIFAHRSICHMICDYILGAFGRRGWHNWDTGQSIIGCFVMNLTTFWLMGNNKLWIFSHSLPIGALPLI